MNSNCPVFDSVVMLEWDVVRRFPDRWRFTPTRSLIISTGALGVVGGPQSSVNCWGRCITLFLRKPLHPPCRLLPQTPPPVSLDSSSRLDQ